jgi:hypothetical protein
MCFFSQEPAERQNAEDTQAVARGGLSFAAVRLYTCFDQMQMSNVCTSLHEQAPDEVHVDWSECEKLWAEMKQTDWGHGDLNRAGQACSISL